jgi:hypothetical protein
LNQKDPTRGPGLKPNDTRTQRWWWGRTGVHPRSSPQFHCIIIYRYVKYIILIVGISAILDCVFGTGRVARCPALTWHIRRPSSARSASGQNHALGIRLEWPLRANCGRSGAPWRTGDDRPFVALPVSPGTAGGRHERSFPGEARHAISGSNDSPAGVDVKPPFRCGLRRWLAGESDRSQFGRRALATSPYAVCDVADLSRRERFLAKRRQKVDSTSLARIIQILS